MWATTKSNCLGSDEGGRGVEFGVIRVREREERERESTGRIACVCPVSVPRFTNFLLLFFFCSWPTDIVNFVNFVNIFNDGDVVVVAVVLCDQRKLFFSWPKCNLHVNQISSFVASSRTPPPLEAQRQQAATSGNLLSTVQKSPQQKLS